MLVSACLAAIVVVAFLVAAMSASYALDASAASPPAAARIPRAFRIHGETIEDDYFWLREKDNPGVRAYLEAENAYTEAVMKPTAALRELLYEEMLGRIKQTDLSVPYRKGAYVYHTRTEEGRQYPIYCRAAALPDAPEEVVLDLNALGEGKPYIALGAYAVSDDGRLLAYSLDTTGFREYELYVKDLVTGEVLPHRFGPVSSVEWAADSRTLFYSTEDEAKRSNRVFRRTLGAGESVLVREEPDVLFSLEVARTRDLCFVLLVSASLETTEVAFIPASDPAAEPIVVAPRQARHEYVVDHQAGRFVIRTNLRAKNFRVVSAPVEAPGIEHWRDEIPHRPSVVLSHIMVFPGHWALFERAQGLPRVRVRDLRSGSMHEVRMPERACSVYAGVNAEYDTEVLRLQYTSYITPDSVYDYDLSDRKLTLLKRTEVLGGYDPAEYETDYVLAEAPDGRRIPVSLVWKRGARDSGPAPLFLSAYGSYGFPASIGFQSSRLSLLDRGIVFARGHIRGGGEMGERWHDEGKMMKKRNTFTDFIACAEHLIATGVTATDRLAIQGGSAGGLLMGAVLNMRPDLFRAAIADVPFVDVINTMLDETLPLTAGEWIEWGNPRKKRHFAYMRSYCPYSNLAARAYPHLLVTTSLNDSQVMYWEPAKYTAKLRTLKTDHNVLLLKTNLDAGHGGASGRYDALRETAFDCAFILAALGLAE